MNQKPRSKRKEEKRDSKKVRGAAGNAGGGTNALFVATRTLPVIAVFSFGHLASTSGLFYSEAERKMNILPRVLFLHVAQSVAAEFLIVLFLQLGRLLVGERVASLEPTRDELAVNDPTISWPPSDLLSAELKRFASRQGQPFSLNHVTGRKRCKDACTRIAMNLGSLFTVWFMCRVMDHRSLSSLGLTVDQPFFVDAASGMLVGVAIVAFTFFVELMAGWIKFLQAFEVFDKSEVFARCIFWDVVFHLNVALNEELPLRGWMLYNLSEACYNHFRFSPLAAVVVAMFVESGMFLAMHLQSPGGTRPQSMVNIFVGGMAGALNVLCTGGRLGFALGWHFGWNISMGNVFGLSTSGIPISATFISVAPHPEKQNLHGGVFGPEGGVVSPLAYLLGIALLVLMYGMPDGKAEIWLAMTSQL